MDYEFEKIFFKECNKKNNIFIFVSKDDEVDTKNLIKIMLEQGKSVIVPICSKKDKGLILSKIEDLKDLKKSHYGILEPKKIKPFKKEDIDIFFVPGTKFDIEGNRKGRGLGYFDRFLKDIKGKKPIIGLCYKNQLVKKLKTEKWDIAVDKIILKRVK